MNHTSSTKIEFASSFLLWFRSSLSQDLQCQLRPYLTHPYQLALKVLACCSIDHPMTVEAIVQQTQQGKAGIRQTFRGLQLVEFVTPTLTPISRRRSQPTPGKSSTIPPHFLSSALQ